MAVKTETARVDSVQGNIRQVYGTLTWTNTDTWSPGLGFALAVDFTPTTNASFGITITNNPVVLTLVSGGSLTGVISASGF